MRWREFEVLPPSKFNLDSISGLHIDINSFKILPSNYGGNYATVRVTVYEEGREPYEAYFQTSSETIIKQLKEYRYRFPLECTIRADIANGSGNTFYIIEPYDKVFHGLKVRL